MSELFPISLKLPGGFSYHENFLTREEEQHLLNLILGVDLHPMMFQGYEAKRKVASFGFDYNFDNRKLTVGKPIPLEFNPLIEKVSRHLPIDPSEVAELLITEYPVGSVINWHRDAPPFDLIAGISLSADCIFKLRPHAKAKQTRKATVSFTVARRSLYVMSGISREEWQHSTAPLDQVRYSITLRTLKKEGTSLVK
ncbi:MAG TPA: alpha-ketoglutarate-dependent dioxygenase AlkB [Chryseosolibacter sp.]